MKREELDRLREKYYAGNTSLEEERLLKEGEGEKFFAALKRPEEKMDWDFDSFMEATKEEQNSEPAKVLPLKRRIILLAGIAATFILGFFFVRQWMVNPTKVESHIAFQEVKKENINEMENIPNVRSEYAGTASDNVEYDAPIRSTSVKKAASKASVASASHEPENEMYVEINGVRIYDEEKALEVTEAALHLATSNIKKGMEGVENIKYLKIEI